VIVHELLHILWRDLDVATASVRDYLAPGVASLWEDAINHETEGLIEFIARLAVELDAE